MCNTGILLSTRDIFNNLKNNKSVVIVYKEKKPNLSNLIELSVETIDNLFTPEKEYKTKRNKKGKVRKSWQPRNKFWE